MSQPSVHRSVRLTPLGLLSATLLAACALAPAQNTTQQQGIYLKDPTPREPDLEQKYDVNGANVGVTDHTALVFSTERQQLIAHASKNLASLATSLKFGVDTHKTGSPMDAEEQIASLIEKLAKNINAALKAGSEGTHTVHTSSDPQSKSSLPEDHQYSPEEERQLLLQADTARLVILTHQLQDEVSLTGRTTLSVGALTRSAEIEGLAKDLKQRLKKGPKS